MKVYVHFICLDILNVVSFGELSTQQSLVLVHVTQNGRIGSRKSACTIPKGIFHVQASFNNIIVTVTDVRVSLVCFFMVYLFFPSLVSYYLC